MKNNYTKIILVIDRSGSMSNIAKDMEGGLRSFIEDQKNNNTGSCDISLYQFDHSYDVVYEDVDIKNAPNYNLVPRGSTSLYDAVGRTINSVGEKLSKINENDRPDRVLFVIITDGQNNTSTEFTVSKVKELINRQSNQYNWTFTYLGSNQDAWSVGSSMGLSSDKVLTYYANTDGTLDAWKSINSNVHSFRKASSGQTAGASFCYSDKDIEAQKRAADSKKNSPTT